MKFQRQLKEEVQVNLTPLIDVVFLLLIFFMITTTFSRNTNLLVTLPEAQGQPMQTLAEEIEIIVAANGNYSVNGRRLIDAETETLQRAILDLSGDERTQPLIITADANSSHQSVVTAMDAVGQLGFSRISIATRHPDDDNNEASR